MKVYLRGKRSPVNLTSSNFVAAGGEGTIHHHDKLAYKIYHDIKKLPPDAKLDELSVLDRPNIIKPIDVIVTKSGDRIGYTTKWVDGIPLCKLFVKGFRNREGIEHKHMIKLLENMADTINYIHDNDIIMVDGNELNYIVGKDFVTPYFIDTTCWQTRSYPATVIMPSIRDWTSKKFTKLSDWFSFGVIACWLLTGMHPFKGKHPKYDSKYNDIGERIKHRVVDCVSIFNKDVRVPANVNLKRLPKEYWKWFINMFENGDRTAPPGQAGTLTTTKLVPKVITGTNNFTISRIPILTSENPIIWHTRIEGLTVTKSYNCIHTPKLVIASGPTTSVIFTPRTQDAIVAHVTDYGKLFVKQGSNNHIFQFKPLADDLMVVDNTMYYRYQGKLTEVKITETSSKTIVTNGTTWNVMPEASTVYAGVVIQNMLGFTHATIPLPPGKCVTKAIPELDNYRVYDAKHTNHVMVVHTYKGNTYQSHVFRFDSSYDKYDHRMVECDNITDVNMIVLDNGIAITIPRSGVLEAYGNKPFVNDIKSIQDPVIDTGMKLCHVGNKAMFINDCEIHTISMGVN